MSGTDAAIDLAISIAITAAMYLAVPVILKITVFRKKHYSKKVYRNIAIANAIVIWAICRAITLNVYSINVPVTYAAAFVWGLVGYKILCHGEKFESVSPTTTAKEETAEVEQGAGTEGEFAEQSESTEGEDLVAWDELFEDGALDKVKQQTSTDNKENLEGKTTAEANIAMETRKDSEIDVKKDLKNQSVTNNSSQDNRPYKKIAIVLGVVCVALVGIMIYMSVSHNNEMVKTRERIAELNEYENDLSTNNKVLYGYKQEVLDFYLNNAVLITEDSNYYHRAECPKLGKKYTYWIYNIEAARDEGYKKCPFCFKIDKEEYVEKYFPNDLGFLITDQ